MSYIKQITFLLSILVVTIVALKLTPEAREKMMKINNECFHESGADDDVVMRAIGGHIADDPKLRDHILCYSKKMGFMNDNGEIQVDIVKTELKGLSWDDGKIDGFVAKCLVHKDTPIETAVEAVKCFHDYNS